MNAFTGRSFSETPSSPPEVGEFPMDFNRRLACRGVMGGTALNRAYELQFQVQDHSALVH